MKNGTKQPHIPILALILKKGAGGGGGGSGDGRGEGKYLCVSVKISQNCTFFLIFLAIFSQKSTIHVFYCYFQQDKFWLHRRRNGEMPGTAHV